MCESDWLEAELRTKLGPVTAPQGLWDRIREPRGTHRNGLAPRRLLWPVIALLMLLASADLLWEFTKARGGLRQFAQPGGAELAGIAAAGERCDMYSDDPARIRQWVKSRIGIELEIPTHSPAVRVAGARVVNVRGTLVASIAYETGTRGGSVLVWRSARGGTEMVPPTASRLAGGSELVSWVHGDIVFAAVVPEGGVAREACLMCHPEGSHGI